MSKIVKLNHWRVDSQSSVMTKKYLFEGYEKTRSFVNDLADLSEKTGYYPNLTFSQSQATVSIYREENEFSEDEYKFAHQTDSIADHYCEKVSLSHD